MALGVEFRNQTLAILTLLFLVVSFTYLISLGTEVCAQANGDQLFTVTEIKVDEKAENDLTAKNSGILKAQQKGLMLILRRLTLSKNHDDLPKLSRTELSNVVRDFSVEGEKFGGGRYLASLTIRFKPHKIRKLLQAEGIAFAETVSRPTIVLPVYSVGGTTVLWEKPNPWLTAWMRVQKDNGLVPIIMPVGDRTDLLQINAEQAIRGDSTRLSSINSKYSSFKTHVAVAELSKNSRDDVLTLKVSLDSYADKNFQSKKEFTFARTQKISIDTLLEYSAKKLITEIEDNWKRGNLLHFELKKWIKVLVPIKGMQEWLLVRRRLDNIAEIRKISLVRLSVSEAELEVLFVGENEQLRSTMAQNALSLSQGSEEGEWNLMFSESN